MSVLLPLALAVQVTYLANEGVRIHGNGCDVLVDALHRDSLADYERHAPDVREKLETAAAPFDGVRVALATHYHLDHWDAGAIARFLGSSPDAVFGAPPQAGGMLPSSVKARFRPLWPEDGQPSARLAEGGAVVDAIPLDHGLPVENLAYRIGCAGRTVAHLGDSQANEANFEKLLAAGPVDVALVPFWWLTSERGLAFVRDRWRPRHVVAFHLGRGDARHAAQIQERLPSAWVAVEPGESRTY